MHLVRTRQEFHQMWRHRVPIGSSVVPACPRIRHKSAYPRSSMPPHLPRNSVAKSSAMELAVRPASGIGTRRASAGR
eukprot:3868312-Alexandrium_andersonii.AAC.1